MPSRTAPSASSSERIIAILLRPAEESTPRPAAQLVPARSAGSGERDTGLAIIAERAGGEWQEGVGGGVGRDRGARRGMDWRGARRIAERRRDKGVGVLVGEVAMA